MELPRGQLRSVGMDPRAKQIPPCWLPAIVRWCSMMQASGLSPETVMLRRAHIAQAARALGGTPGDLDVDDLLAWLGSREWGRETRRAYRSSLRGFFIHLGRADVAEAIPSVKATDPSPNPIPETALQAGLGAADDRTRLILRLAAELGLRRGEIAKIHAVDVGECRGGAALTVHGKGGRVRVIPMGDSLAAALRLRAGGGFVFPGGSGPGHLSPRRVGELATLALPVPWTLHKLRHRFATVVHEGSRDLLIVQELLGHASLATTQRYVAVNVDRLREAVQWAA